jgi:hypothetical protein
MDAVLPFAEQMLATHGEFHPYGGAMLPNGQFVSVSGYDGNELPPATDVIALIKAGLVAAARKGDYKATAIVYNARVKLSSSGDMSDAIAVSLDHRDNYSVVVFVPYKIDSGKLSLGTTLAQKGAADIFSAQ